MNITSVSRSIFQPFGTGGGVQRPIITPNPDAAQWLLSATAPDPDQAQWSFASSGPDPAQARWTRISAGPDPDQAQWSLFTG